MGFLGDVFGSKQKTTSPGAGQQAALTEDISSMGRIGQLGNLYNTQQNQAAMSQYTSNLPGFQSSWNQAATNTGQQLQGQIPSDVTNLETQLMAERGIMGGQTMTNSPNANAAWLRAMGQTSQGEMQQGMSNLSGMMQEMPKGSLFNPNEFLVTPMQQYQAQQNSYGIEAQPDPTLSTLNKEIMSFGGMASGNYLGGLMGSGMQGGSAGSGTTSLTPQLQSQTPNIDINVDPTINAGGSSGGAYGGGGYFDDWGGGEGDYSEGLEDLLG